MKLTGKQKLAVESIKNLGPEDIAQKLNLPAPEVRHYLESRGHSTIETKKDSSGIIDELYNFWRGRRLKILLIIGLGLLVYSSALPNGFVSDDLPLLKSPNLQNPLNQIINEPVSAFLNSLTYTLNYYLHGTNPLGYHLVNILFHITFTLTAYFFLSLLTKERVAFFASLLFLVVPLHAEPVIWVSGRHYILYAIFVLLSLILHLFAAKPEAPARYRSWSVIFFVFAVYSFPEQALVLPFLLILIDFYQGRLRQGVKSYWPYILLAGIFTLLSLSRVALRIQDVRGSNIPLSSPQINFIQADIVALSTYLQLFLVPLGLTFYHEAIPTGSLDIAIRTLVIIIFFFVPLVFIKKNRFFILSVGIFLVALLPTITPFRVSWIVAERYAYLSALGPAMLVAYVIDLAIKKLQPNRLVKYIFAAIILAYSAITFFRGFDWKDEDSLWLATIKTSPTSSKALNNIGDYYGRHGDPQKSFESFVKATQINPAYSDAWHNAGNVLLQNGRPDDSIPYFEKSLQFNPSLVEAYTKLAWIYHEKGDQEKAGLMIKEALRIRPNDPNTYNLLASIEYENHNVEAAIEAIRKGLSTDPGNTQLQKNLQLLESLR
ncbi:MAG: tetratricopeptide repeat protein [Patescibacteria group bacterium]